MNTLEKILKDIEDMCDIMKSTVTTDCFGKECEHNDCTVCVCERAMEIIRSHMNHNGDDTEMVGWIPVGDRLPEEGEKVLVWYEYFRYGEYNCMYETYGIGWQFDGHWGGDVIGTKARCIAWQPLPAPYKGELNPKDIPHTCDTCRRYGKSDHNCYYCKRKPREDLWEPKEG